LPGEDEKGLCNGSHSQTSGGDIRATSRAFLLAIVLVAVPALAQAPTPPVVALAITTSVVVVSIRIVEGAGMLVRFDEELSSGRNSQGDKFSISLDDTVELSVGVVLASG
jgi:hypothetical protein